MPECGTYWGTWVSPEAYGQGHKANEKLTAIREMEKQVGRGFDIDHQFYRWDDFANTYNVEKYLEPSIADGRIQMLSWKAVTADNQNVSWRSIADGQYDDMIRSKARAVRGLGVPVMVIFDHEANARVGKFQPGDTGGGHIKADAGSAADYVAAWRHIHGLFQEQSADNVSWVWVMSRTPFGGDATFADRLYPGEQYVDWVGVDPYNFFHGQRSWRTLKQQMGTFTSWIDSRNIDKPWILAEWGSVEDANQSGRKAEWYRHAGDYIQSEPRLKATVHFESNAENDWRIYTSASSKAAFTEIGKRRHFNQRC